MAGEFDTATIQLLAQLMSGAKSGNRNVSGLLGNMDNPLLLALAGQLDPFYGSNASSGGLYGQFASDQTTPAAVRSVMDWVDQGMNKYQIEAQINSLPESVKTDSGYTDDQLIAMGRDMAKERSSSPAGMFAKAGFRNPTDIYTYEDQPMSSANQATYASYLDAAAKNKTAYDYAAQEERKAKVAFEKATSGVNGVTLPRDKVDSLIRVLRSQSSIPKYGSVLKKIEKQYKAGEPIVLTEDDYGGFAKDQNPYKIIQDIGTRNMDLEAWKKTQRASTRRADAERKIKADENRAIAVAEGNLQSIQAAGRTPFTDQAAALMRFLGASK